MPLKITWCHHARHKIGQINFAILEPAVRALFLLSQARDASTPDLFTALEYVLSAELGPTKDPITVAASDAAERNDNQPGSSEAAAMEDADSVALAEAASNQACYPIFAPRSTALSFISWLSTNTDACVASNHAHWAVSQA